MTRIDITNSRVMEAVDVQTFRKKFRLLIFITWSVPVIFGLSFILYLKILSMPEMVAVMTHPLEPLFMVFWFTFSLWYFIRFAQPIVADLENFGDESIPAGRDCMRRFPLHFWSLILLYLLMAPVSVIWAAELYAGFVPQPVDWFRINMVALIVSFIVGLPIFFLFPDLFGRALSGVHMGKPHITVKLKFFLIGALVPLENVFDGRQPLLLKLIQRFKILSTLCTPLRLEGKPIGVLMSSSMKIRRDYSACDKAVIQGLAREAALAINTQRLNDQALQAQVAQHEQR